MRVAVYAIALDERQHVERFLQSALEADVVVVADTGSSDGTVEALRAGGAIVHEISVRPWRFDDARNASLALVPSDIDVCLPLDLDEVLAPGWRACLELEWGDATRGRYRFVWKHQEDGTDGGVFQRDRVHARHGYRWEQPCHEVLQPDRIEERSVDLSFEGHHWPDDSKSRANYLPLLEVGAAERPDDPRASHYLGREYMFQGRYEEAVAELQRHLALPRAIWAPERAASCRFMGRCLNALHHHDAALDAFREATREDPSSREAWIELAQMAHDFAQWNECWDAAAAALAIERRDDSYMTESWAWNERADDLAAIAAWNLGDREAARFHGERAAALAPGDERLAKNVRWYTDTVIAGPDD